MLQNETSASAPILTPEFVQLQRALAGRYSLIRELGRGGMGVVFLVREVALDRLVAIKMLLPALAPLPSFRDRFLTEALLAARLSHPHIIPIYQVDESEGLAWFAMEYVDGGTLASRIATQGPLSPEDGLRVVLETAWALAHAHARGVVHRDVKPDNVLLESGTDRVRVTDFGIAAPLDVETTPAPFGTAHFADPLQFESTRLPDPGVDIYALGVTAWMTFAGRRPFEGLEGVALLAAQSTSAPPSLAAACPHLPASVCSAIDRSVARDPADRFASMEEFATALSHANRTITRFPLPLRRFALQSLEHSDRLGLALGVGSAGLIGALSIDAFWSGLLGFEMIPYLIVTMLAASSSLLLITLQLQRVRELAQHGYSREAAARAIEELGADQTLDPPTGLSRDPRILIALGTFGTLWAIWASTKVSSLFLYAPAMMLALLMPVITLRGLARVRQLKNNWWSRLMRGKVGRAFWKVATLGLRPVPEVPVGGEPTALVVGTMVQSLYSALAPAEQRLLADVPDLAARLERDALGDDRDRAAAAMAALETLRLDLLRLRAGQLQADGLTDDLVRLRDVGYYVDAKDELP